MLDRRQLVVCVDVGSIATGKFGWAASDGTHGSDIHAAAEVVTKALDETRQVALGFECPGWIPVRDAPAELGRSRPGEGRYPWSGGPGATVIATGIAQISWLLGRIAESRSGPSQTSATTDRGKWSEDRPLLLWEAFVAGDRKPAGTTSDLADAEAGVKAFDREQTLSFEQPAGTAVNLLALLATWAGVNVDLAEHRQAFPIYAPRIK